MKRVALAVGFALIASSPAFAQYIPRPAVPVGAGTVEDVTEIVQAMGLDPVGQPARSGAFFVQRARDDFGRLLSVTVDARRSQVLAVEATGAWGHRAAYGGPFGRRPYPAYGMPADHHAAIAPPGSIMAPRHAGLPPQAAPQPIAPQQPQSAPRPAAKSAAVAPQRPPLPRKRPATAPQEVAGSVEPVAAAPQNAPAPAPVEAVRSPAPAKPAEPQLTPVAPLE